MTQDEDATLFRKRRRAHLRSEFLGLVGGYLRLAGLAALPPVIAWTALPLFGVPRNQCFLATLAVAALMTLLLVWSFVRIWKSNSAFIRSKYGEFPKT